MDLEDAVLSEISHGRDKRSENRLTEKTKLWLPDGERGELGVSDKQTHD